MSSRFAAAWVSAATVLLAAPAFAATLTVTSTADAGAGSLRQAIAEAQPSDTITFTVTGVITLSSELLIDKDLTITGPGFASLRITGNNACRLFHVTSGVVSISGLMLSSGYTTGNDGGAAINNAGTLTVTDCTLSSNNAADYTDRFGSRWYGRGGAVYNSGTASFTRCNLSGNRSMQGGAIFNGGSPLGAGGARLSMTDCSLSSNRGTGDDYNQSNGAAIDNRDRLTLIRCKFTSNTHTTANAWSVVINYDIAVLDGCEFRANTGTQYSCISNWGYMEMSNSTVRGNSAGGGSGIWNTGALRLTNCTFNGNTVSGTETGTLDNSAVTIDAMATVTNCTFNGNNANQAGCGSSIFCGVYNTGVRANVSVANTIVTRQVSAPSMFLFTAGFPNASFTSRGYNLANDSPAYLNQSTDLKNVDPKLGTLQDNGAPVWTCALLAGSPALDAASPFSFPAMDARGALRPQDGEGNGTSRADIGAFEAPSTRAVPLACTEPATNLTGTGATLHATVNPNGVASTACLEWGADTTYGTTSPDLEIGNGTANAPFSRNVSGFTLGSTVHYRVVGKNGNGTVLGADATFPVANSGAGTALSLDLTGRLVDLPPAVYFTGDLTIEAWVLRRSSTQDARLVEFGNGSDADNVVFALSQGTTGRPWFQVFEGTTSPGTVVSSSAIPLNKWTHVAATLSGNVGRIYIDGVLSVTGNTGTPQNVLRKANTIGFYNWRAWGTAWPPPRLPAFPDAIIDELRIWNVALPVEQIQANKGKVLDLPVDGLVNVYHFDEGAGTVLHDAGPDHLDGTIYSPDWRPSTAPILGGTPKFTTDDLMRALKISAGLVQATLDDLTRANLATASPSDRLIDLSDCVLIARKVAGLDPNP